MLIKGFPGLFYRPFIFFQADRVRPRYGVGREGQGPAVNIVAFTVRTKRMEARDSVSKKLRHPSNNLTLAGCCLG